MEQAVRRCAAGGERRLLRSARKTERAAEGAPFHFAERGCRLAVFRWDIFVGAGAERLIGNVRVGLQLVPKLSLDRRDVEADPAIILTRISPGRRLQVSTRRRGAIEDDVVLLAWIPPQIVNRRDLQGLILSKPGILGGIQRLVILDAQAPESLVVEVDEIVALAGPCAEQRVT